MSRIIGSLKEKTNVFDIKGRNQEVTYTTEKEIDKIRQLGYNCSRMSKSKKWLGTAI